MDKPPHRLTSPQKMLLSEFSMGELDFGKLIKKSLINKQASKASRSGNLETPLKDPKHRKMMGQSDNPHGTRADKPSRPQAENIRATPTSMEDPSGLIDLGEPLERGLSDNAVGDDASFHPSSTKQKPTRLQGPSETPGKQTWTSFGNRYPGARNV